MSIYKLLVPSIGSNQRVISGTAAETTMRQLQARGTRSNAQIWNMLDGHTLRIIMQARGIDTFGTTDLLLFKDILRHMGLEGFPGLPATNVFCIDQQWVFEITRAENPDIVEFVSDDYGVHTQTAGPMELKPLKGGAGINWILGHAFRLKGVRFTCLPATDVVKQGGLESSNMVIGAATAAGSILRGIDWDLGTIFTEATRWENDVLGGLTGGQGLAAGILGGAHSVEWAAHMHPYAGVARELFGPERYGEFEAHVGFLLPVSKDEDRASVDINQQWTAHALTKEGSRVQSVFTKLSQQAAAGYSAQARINWAAVTDAVQQQTDIRANICPAFLGGVEDLARALVVRQGDRILRAIARPGAGGPGTPVLVYSTTEELAREAVELVENRLDYRLSPTPIQFEGIREAGFAVPAQPIEIRES
ncbi:MAG: hypothetical protein HQ596_00150 [Candidatus Saganbacteria bacterium]|nr:hypothetical protein [Candidatus Saganbacteria bacterium]